VRFAELDGAQDWDRFFAHRCEGALRQLLEADADLFLGLLELFGAPPAPGSRAAGFPADHRLVLPLLPRVPWLICHTAADGDFEAAVTLLFDRTASRHLSGGALYQLVQGVIEMLRQIAARHSGPRL